MIMIWQLSIKFRRLNIDALDYSNLNQRLWATAGWMDMPENVKRNRIINRLEFLCSQLLRAKGGKNGSVN